MNLQETKAIAIVTNLGYEYWGKSSDDSDYLEAICCDSFYPDFPKDTPVYSSNFEPFINVAIGENTYIKNIAKIWTNLGDRDACEAEVKKLRSALWQSRINWVCVERKNIDCDKYTTTYKGFGIYLFIPYGIIGAGFVIPDKPDGWGFGSDDLGADVRQSEHWHIARCQEKIDELFPDVRRQTAIGRCPMPTLTI